MFTFRPVLHVTVAVTPQGWHLRSTYHVRAPIMCRALLFLLFRKKASWFPPPRGGVPARWCLSPARGEGTAGAEALVLAAPLTASIFGAGTKGKIFLAFIPNPAVLENMNNYRGTLRSKINPQATLVSFGEYGSLFILSVKSDDDLAIIRNILNIRLCATTPT